MLPVDNRTPDIAERYDEQLRTSHTAENIHLSLCGGMGADVYLMRIVGAKFTKAILVEKDETKRVLGGKLNPPEMMPDGGVVTQWSTIGIPMLGTLLVLASRHWGVGTRCIWRLKLKNLHHGLHGKHGRVLLACLHTVVIPCTGGDLLYMYTAECRTVQVPH